MKKQLLFLAAGMVLASWATAQQALPIPPFTASHADAKFQFLVKVMQYEKGTNTLLQTVYFGNYDDAVDSDDTYNVAASPGGAPNTATLVLPDTQLPDFWFQVYLKPSHRDNTWAVQLLALKVDGVVPLREYDLRWTILRDRGGYLAQRQLIIRADNLTPLDMQTSSSLTANTRTLYTVECISSTLEVSDDPRAEPIALNLTAGWNLIALPISLLDKNRTPLAKPGGGTYAETFLQLKPYVLENGGYVTVTSPLQLLGGRAFWIYTATPTTLNMNGYDFLHPGFAPRDWSQTGWSMTGHQGLNPLLTTPPGKILLRWDVQRWIWPDGNVNLNDKAGYMIR